MRQGFPIDKLDAYEERKDIPKQAFQHLIPEFLQAMDDIGAYGEEKYTYDSFQIRRISGDRKRFSERVESVELKRHAAEHFTLYDRRMLHDHFGTLRHQLAAVAFNAMMEFFFAGLDHEAK